MSRKRELGYIDIVQPAHMRVTFSLAMANGEQFKLLASAQGVNPSTLRDIDNNPLVDSAIYYLTPEGYSLVQP